MAKFDMPAMINYVLEVTGQQILSYIGYQQGSTIMFTALAEDYGQMQYKVNLFVALAPLAYVESENAVKKHEKDVFPYI